MLECCMSYKEKKCVISVLMEHSKKAEETSNLISNRKLDSLRNFEGTKGQKNRTKRSGIID